MTAPEHRFDEPTKLPQSVGTDCERSLSPKLPGSGACSRSRSCPGALAIAASTRAVIAVPIAALGVGALEVAWRQMFPVKQADKTGGP